MNSDDRLPNVWITFSLLILPFFIILAIRAMFPGNYLVNSLYKIVFLSPLLFRMITSKATFAKALFKGFCPDVFVRKWKTVLITGIILTSVYIAAFLIFKPLFDIEGIKDRLVSRNGINGANILVIGAFIILVNSFLEEYFWRGFIFTALRERMNIVLAHIISGLAFSLHHIVFIYDWFSVPLMILIVIGLAGYSIIMNIFYIKYEDLISIWVIHIMVDIVQISLGIYLLKPFG